MNRAAIERRVAVLPERGAEILRLYLDGATLREIGARFGLTGARIHQIVGASGIPNAAQHSADARAKAAPSKPKVRRTHKRCVVCGKRLPYPEGTGRVTDTPECAAAWPTLRFTDAAYQAKHRVIQARYVMAHPDQHDGVRIRWAEGVMRGEAAGRDAT